MSENNYYPKSTPETGHEEWLRKDRHGDDPAREFRISINGHELFKDEHFDSLVITRDKPKKTSALFDQVIADTRARLIEIGEIKV